MVEGMGTVAHRRLVGMVACAMVASGGAAQVPGTTPPLAAPQAPPVPVASTQPGAWWAWLGPASGNDAVRSLRFRPPALRATMFADALAASEVRADPALRDRVLLVVAAFPEQASALVAEFLAAEPPANERDRSPRRASKGALAFVGAVAERATAAEAARLAAWIEALGSPEVWQQLTAVAASIPHREDGGPAWYKANTVLAAHFVLASQQVGLITWPEPPGSANPPGPGPIENRDPLLEFWLRRWHYLDAPPKAPPRWFAGVQLHRRDIDGLPAIEFTLRPADPSPR